MELRFVGISFVMKLEIGCKKDIIYIFINLNLVLLICKNVMCYEENIRIK